MKKMILAAMLMLSLVGCGQHETVVYQQPVQPVVAQPVYVANPDPMAGVITGMVIGSLMSNGMRYDGHNGYYDSRYHGPSRTIVRNTTIINNTKVNNVNPSVHNPGAPVSKPVASVANPSPAPVKTGFAARPASAPTPKASFTSRPSSSPSKSSGGFPSRRK